MLCHKVMRMMGHGREHGHEDVNASSHAPVEGHLADALAAFVLRIKAYCNVPRCANMDIRAERKGDASDKKLAARISAVARR